jgi:hypothetical protein
VRKSVPPAVDIQGRPKISVSLALDNIREVVEELGSLDLEYAARRQALQAERDEMLIDALDSRVAVAALRAVSGLSRSRLYRLRDRAYPGMTS